MFNSSNIYQMFFKNGVLVTDYEILIGGTTLSANFKKGAIIITPINQKSLTSFDYNFKELVKIDDDNYNIKGSELLELTYQVDIYKINDENYIGIQAEEEVIKIRKWLKSFEVSEYLKTLNNTQILPNYSQVRQTSEYINNNLVNRASFDFKIITINEQLEQVETFNKITLDNVLILN